MKGVIYARQSSGKEDLSESVEAQIQNCLILAEKEKIVAKNRITYFFMILYLNKCYFVII